MMRSRPSLSFMMTAGLAAGAGCSESTAADTDTGTSTGAESTTDVTTVPSTATSTPPSGSGDAGTTIDPATSSTESSGASDDGPSSMCGDGEVDPGEDCDDGGESATCNEDCTSAECGDGQVNVSAGEACDGEDLAEATCEDQGFDGGTLACDGGCALVTDGCGFAPGVPSLALGFSAIKQFDFTWGAVPDATHYEIERIESPGEPWQPWQADLTGTSASINVPLHLRYDDFFRLRACNEVACSEPSPQVGVVTDLAEAVGYIKATNTDPQDLFGSGLAISGDGNTLAVASILEDSSATGVDGDQSDNESENTGAVYIYVRDPKVPDQWVPQTYLKASNPDELDGFGFELSLSHDGGTLAVGAAGEDGGATGINGSQSPFLTSANSGAVYVFVRFGVGQWTQQAYVKASNTGDNDRFGTDVALSADGDTLAVGAGEESSNAMGIDGEDNDFALRSGAAYVYTRDEFGEWSQQAYLKASNTDAQDQFGSALDLSDDGNTLAIGAYREDSNATGVGGDQEQDTAEEAGAVYIFTRGGAGMDLWSQQAYVKASNTDPDDRFGESLALSGDGETLAVGARFEDAQTSGIDGDETDDTAENAGAVYVFIREGAGMDQWSQQAYVKASNPNVGDEFSVVALSGDGNLLAVGAPFEDSTAVGVGGTQDNNDFNLGAAYVFQRDAMDAWAQVSYVKASNTSNVDDEWFGRPLALSDDGETLIVGGTNDDSNAVGVGGDQGNDLATNAGAVYVY